MVVKKNTEGQRKMLDMYVRGLSILEISEKVGLSRQRVHQILKKIDAPMRSRGKPRGESKDFVCKTCGTKFSSQEKRRVFCSQECSRNYTRVALSKEERAKKEELKKEFARKRASKYYHEVFKKREGWSDVVRERNIRNKKKSYEHSK